MRGSILHRIACNRNVAYLIRTPFDAVASAAGRALPDTTKPPGDRGFHRAGTLDLCSHFAQGSFTPDGLRKLAVPRSRPDGVNKRVSYRPQELLKRLGEKKAAELVRRVERGESVRSLAQELGVANSALTRMLRAQGASIAKRKVSDATACQMAAEYEAGTTIRELEVKHGLSHGAVYRALHRVGAAMREPAPRRK